MNQSDLPVDQVKELIVATIQSNPVTIITAEGGAGKSTRIPLFLLEAGYENVIVTQPRKLAARTVSAWVAEQLGEPLGQTVGYRTGDDRLDSKKTKVLFCTDGLALVRELMESERETKNYLLVIDEVHEWNLNIEVLVAWAKLELGSNSSFKLVLMSYTLQAEELSAFFDNAPVIDIPGRLFPITDVPPGRSMEVDAARLVNQGCNVVVFQPGKVEIENTIRRLKTEMKVNAEVLPLHGGLNAEDQEKCFRSYGRPKIVVSTNVAQTSVTIPDIDAVVDSGMEKKVLVKDGVEGLFLTPISEADAKQRRARAGRTRPGYFIDHCPATDRPAFPTAEVERVRLDQTILRLLVAGIDMEELEFFHQPTPQAIRMSKESLRTLGCITKSNVVTQIGRQVAQLPLSASIGRMIVEAIRLDKSWKNLRTLVVRSQRATSPCLDDVITVAAILEEGGIVDRKSSAWRSLCPDHGESDLIAQLLVYKASENMPYDLMRDHGIFIKGFRRVKEIRQNIRKALHLKKVDQNGDCTNREAVLKAVCAGMVDNLFKVTSSSNRLSKGDTYRDLGRESLVQAKAGELIVGMPFNLEIEVRRGRRVLELVVMATKVKIEWLEEVAPQLCDVKVGLNPQYDPQKDSVTSVTESYFNGSKIREILVEDPSHSDAADLFASWLAGKMTNSWSGTDELLPELRNIVEANKLQQARAQEINVRSGEQLFRLFDRNSCEEFVKEALHGISRMVDILDVTVLEYPKIEDELVTLVMEENPNQITVDGIGSCDVHYADNYPSITIRENWHRLPNTGFTLPGGRAVMVKVSVSPSVETAGISTGPELAVLKRSCADLHARATFDSWDRPVVVLPEMESPSDLVPLKKEVLGCCPLTGTELLAYGTPCHSTLSNEFVWGWYFDKKQAEEEHSAVLERLTEITQIRAAQEKASKELERRQLEETLLLAKEKETSSNEDTGLEKEDDSVSFAPSDLKDLFEWRTRVRDGRLR
jgi:hypothetical protein